MDSAKHLSCTTDHKRLNHPENALLYVDSKITVGSTEEHPLNSLIKRNEFVQPQAAPLKISQQLTLKLACLKVTPLFYKCTIQLLRQR